jgi:uncharacterized membrane protein
MLIRLLMCGLSLAGLADALYFTFAYYGRIKKARWVPEVLCAREGSSCVTVVQTPYARVLGLPNSVLGIVYYTLVIAWAIPNRSAGIHLLFHPFKYAAPLALALLFLISAGTIVFGSYLIYALRRKLHVDCPLCYTAHAINAALFVMFVMIF